MEISETGILIVDDERIVRQSLTKWFSEEGFRVEAAENAAEALKKLRDTVWHILLVDIKMPGMDGIELLTRVREINPDITVIMITAFASVDSAVKALKSGAYDYVTKPIDPDYLNHLIQNVLRERHLTLENIRLKDTLRELSETEQIIGDSAPMKAVLDAVTRVSPTDTTVMIRGESGTGKELIARAIHRMSPRRYFPLVVVNCGAMTESLLESELFGHERGAFTGAQYRRKGKVELADGGTLFLDEIGNIDSKTQMDLLRVIETKRFMRVGGSETLRSDFRVVSATNRDLEKAVREGTFREDLYYRLNVFEVPVPPLRSRRDDIPALTQHFVQKYARAMNRCIDSVSSEAMTILTEHDWPGNIRELENAIERAIVVCDGRVIQASHLPVPGRNHRMNGGRSLQDIERTHIARILEETGWNISRSARILNIDRATLYSKIEKMQIKQPT